MKWLLAFILLLAVIGCGGSAKPDTTLGGINPRGQVVSYQKVKSYGRIELEAVLVDIFATSGISMLAESGVDFYKVQYRTIDVLGRPTVATGAVAIPSDPGSLALVSYQHGTTTQRTDVPSFQSDEALAATAIYAATGDYVVAMADYLGLGDNPGLHPYLHAPSQASASLDMMRAARNLCNTLGVTLNSKVFLNGYSQGGHATMALFKAIESTDSGEFPLTAVALGSGPFDLSDTQMKYAINEPSTLSPTFITYVLLSYRNVYGILPDLSTAMISPWNLEAPPLFTGNYSNEQVAATLPASLNDLYKAPFIEDVLKDPTEPFVVKLKENDNWQWVPSVPTTFYGSSTDEIVSFQNSQKAFNYMQGQGADVTLVNYGPGVDHVDGFYYAVPKARKWFDTLNPQP